MYYFFFFWRTTRLYPSLPHYINFDVKRKDWTLRGLTEDRNMFRTSAYTTPLPVPIGTHRVKNPISDTSRVPSVLFYRIVIKINKLKEK